MRIQFARRFGNRNRCHYMAKRATQPDRLYHERQLWSQGVQFVAGVDEAGRGPLAGQVVAAAVILPARWSEVGIPSELRELNDSKQLTQAQR